MRNFRKAWVAAALLLATGSGVFAFGLKQDKGRFDDLSIADPSLVTDIASTPVDALPAGNGLRVGWQRFSSDKSGGWRVQIDGRSGAPLLVEGPGIPWPVAIPAGSAAAESDLRNLEASLRDFVARNRELLLARDEELVLDRDATGPFGTQGFHVSFQRQVDGVIVEGDRYVFHLGHGNLTSFGTSRWTRADVRTTPDLTAPAAIETMADYMKLQGLSGVRLMADPVLRIVPDRAEGGVPHSSAFAGEIGRGYTAHLVWRVVLEVDGEPGTWVGMVDAHDGTMRALFDDVRYAQVKGGVFPEAPDGICPSGCEQANFPMPFANVSIGGAPVVTSNHHGFFNCTPVGATALTQLQSPTIRISDACGAISESAVCGNDIQLDVNNGTNCTVPAGHSAGDTRASRSCFFVANRLKEHARAYLPGNVWVNTTQTQVNANVNQTCNAQWTTSQQLNMFRNGGGCNNTCEIAGVVAHEWGHGMDQNDGGGFDNSSEAYGDISEFLYDHSSCVGRGFFQSGTCSGYGDTCLTCTGIREMDWNARVQHTPARISGTLIGGCPSGSGPCGKEVHCEAFLAGESIYDLATRDLPAAGYDAATAWQIVDRIWFTSRTGSSGNMYTCTAGSGGCGATSLYQRLRTADDDDGNLSNGTPHAAAIFAAFARHDIACGAAGDAGNQSSSFPPVVSALSLSGAGSTNSAILVIKASGLTPDTAASYKILRNDLGCASSFTIVGTAPGSATSFTDTGLANGMPVYYRVQAVGANPAHESAVSNCVPVTPQPFAGNVVTNAGAYSCASAVTINVLDGNIGADTVNVTVTSNTETTPETVTLTAVVPGAATYTGSINTTAAAPAADGQLSVVHGDTITVHYVDADDGLGGSNVPHDSTSTADCLGPAITNVLAGNLTGTSARITWSTDEGSDSRVQYGTTAPPANSTTVSTLVTSHQVNLSELAPCSDYVFSVGSADAQGNLAWEDNGGTYYTFTTGQAANPSYPSAGPPVPIPDNDPTGASLSLSVPDNRPVLDVNVRVNITHTFDGDFSIQLVPPVGAPIMLSNRRGASGDNYTNTVFDDEAVTSITAGTAPFTGSFRPESSLTALDGMHAAGTWTLRVVDQANQNVGTIDNWTLLLTFPAGVCGPHAVTTASTNVSDVCTGTGTGSGNGLWESGEDVAFSVTVSNDGGATLTGVTATITSPTPGVSILDGSAAYPDLLPGDASVGNAPFFKVRIPTAAACNSSVQINVQVSTDQGSWPGTSFTRKVGLLGSASVTALNESFAGGIPGSWTVVNGGSGGGAAATWTTANPGNRVFVSPLVAPVAIVDSDNAGFGPTQDEELITPVIDLSSAISVVLDFDQFFRWYVGSMSERGDVDVRSSNTGGAWVNVLRMEGASSPEPDHKALNITAQAAGAANVQIRFHYYNAAFERYWEVDNVKVTATLPPPCTNAVCTGAAGLAKPANALGASRVDPSTIAVSWDAASCTSTDYELLFGNLTDLPSYTLSGSVCGLGTSGSASWSSVPAGDLWFLVTGVDGAGTEATWGPATAGERNGGSASNQCGNAARNDGTTCP